MPGQAFQILLRGQAAFNALDADGLRAIAHPDVEWGTTGAFPGMDEVYRGRDGIVRWADEVRSAWERFDVELEEVIEDRDDVVVVLERIRGRGRDSGVEVEMATYAVYTARDGLIVRRAAYRERERAIADPA